VGAGGPLSYNRIISYIGMLIYLTAPWLPNNSKRIEDQSHAKGIYPPN
jgi:hypothetical protein